MQSVLANRPSMTTIPKREFWDCSMKRLRKATHNGMAGCWLKPHPISAKIRSGASCGGMTLYCSGRVGQRGADREQAAASQPDSELSVLLASGRRVEVRD